jgi:hypothetical protein
VRDVTVTRYRNWDGDAYCRLSAMPVGRYVPDMAKAELWPANDALCSALRSSITCRIAERDYRLLNQSHSTPA